MSLSYICRKKSVLGGGAGTAIILVLLAFFTSIPDTYVEYVEAIENDIIDIRLVQKELQVRVENDEKLLSSIDYKLDSLVDRIGDLKAIVCKDSTSNQC